MTPSSPSRKPTSAPHDGREIAVHGLLLRWRASGLQTGSRFWTPWSAGDDALTHTRTRTRAQILISPTKAPPPRGWPTLDRPRAASEDVVIANCPTSADRFLLSYPSMPYPEGPVFQVTTDRVLIHRGDDTAPAELSWFLIGPVLSFLLAVRGAAVFHGSAVRFDDRPGDGSQERREGVAAAFIGPSGAGKSTLAAALAGRGRPGVTDDLLVLEGDPPRKEAATPWRILPGAPRRLLWPDSMRRLDATGSASLDAAAPNAGATGTAPTDTAACRWDKHALPARAWVPGRPLPLDRLFYLRPAPASAEPSLRPMPGHRATAALLGNLRLAWLAGRRRRRDLETVTRLVDRRGIEELVVPRDFDRLPAVLDLVEDRLAGAGTEAPIHRPTAAS